MSNVTEMQLKTLVILIPITPMRVHAWKNNKQSAVHGVGWTSRAQQINQMMAHHRLNIHATTIKFHCITENLPKPLQVESNAPIVPRDGCVDCEGG